MPTRTVLWTERDTERSGAGCAQRSARSGAGGPAVPASVCAPLPPSAVPAPSPCLSQPLSPPGPAPLPAGSPGPGTAAPEGGGVGPAAAAGAPGVPGHGQRSRSPSPSRGHRTDVAVKQPPGLALSKTRAPETSITGDMEVFLEAVTDSRPPGGVIRNNFFAGRVVKHWNEI